MWQGCSNPQRKPVVVYSLSQTSGGGEAEGGKSILHNDFSERFGSIHAQGWKDHATKDDNY